MTITEVIGYCISAFGIGYGCGYCIYLWRKTTESLD